MEIYPEVEKKVVFDSFPLYKKWLKAMAVPNSIKLFQWPSSVMMFFPVLCLGKVFLSWLHAYIMPIPTKTNIQLSDRRPRIFEEYVSSFERTPVFVLLFNVLCDDLQLYGTFQSEVINSGNQSQIVIFFAPTARKKHCFGLQILK